MMRLSTKGRYGARLMLELALNYGNGNVLLKDIAKRQDISEGYLEHIVPPLKALGLIKSSRGAQGGYTLGKHPSKIRLSEIVLILEGSISPVECIDTPSVCNRADCCTTRDIWKELGDKMLESLKSITLEEMVKRHKKKSKTPHMYVI